MPVTPEIATPAFDDELLRTADVAECLESLARFAERYKPRLARLDQGDHLDVYLEGLVSGLERKSIEPIATAHGLYRRPLQHFIGAGKWSDVEMREEMQRHIVEEIGDAEAVLVLDGSSVPKKGEESVGVARQWCGRLGKIDNCQLGVYLAYSAPRGMTLLDADLYLPKDWARDGARREKAYVPPEVKFRKNWQLADALLQRIGPNVPHAWVVGDEDFGRPSAFRDRLADRNERYLLEIPSNTLVRRPPSWPGRKAKWCTVARRQAHHPLDTWTRIKIRDGEKGPIEVDAFCTRVETKRNGKPAREETLLIMRTRLRTEGHGTPIPSSSWDCENFGG